MSVTKANLPQRTPHDTPPPFDLSADLIDCVLTAIPPPPPDAPAAWRRARLTQLIAELAAFAPSDAAQARLGGQIVVAQALAEDTARRSCAEALPVEQMCRLRRATGELMRTAERLDRGRARRQARAVPGRDAPAAEGFDLGALDSIWLGEKRDACETRQEPMRPEAPVVHRTAPMPRTPDAEPRSVTLDPVVGATPRPVMTPAMMEFVRRYGLAALRSEVLGDAGGSGPETGGSVADEVIA